MNREELLELREIKERELDKIDAQLEEIYAKKLAEAESWVGKYYKINNSDSYFRVSEVDPDTKILYGTELFLTPIEMSITTTYMKAEIGNLVEVSKQEIEKEVKGHGNLLIEQFMRE